MTQPETLSKPGLIVSLLLPNPGAKAEPHAPQASRGSGRLRLGLMLRQLSHKAADYIERILKKILPQIKKETIKRLLVWAGWVLMLIAETVLDSVE